MRATILNRSGQIPEDGWYQIEVTGTHPAGKKRRQVIDDKALSSIVNRFAAEKAAAGDNWSGMLVDADHLSHDLDKSTAAFAWAQDLRIHEGQLQARLDLTDLGEPAIKNKRFKFFSTEYSPEDLEDLGNGDVRPLRLSGLAFTNRPNNRGGKPISNRADDSPGEQAKTNTMKSIAEKLGLSAEATEADILAAIESLQSANKDMKGKQAEGEASAVMNRFGDRIPEAARPEWKKRLIANRADTEPLMETTFPEKVNPPGRDRIHNRDTTTSPAPVEKGGKEIDARAQDAFVEETRIKNRCSFHDAWGIARRQRPELFDN